jgi:DNA-binding CsgD family transcriptional regulator
MPCVADAFPKPVLDAIAQLARHNWRLASRTMTDQGIRRDDEQEGLAWAQMLEASLPGETMARFIETHAGYDVTELLDQVVCPTLICHSRNDRVYPFELGLRMARLIPNAHLVPLESDAAGPFTNAAEAIKAIHAFLAELPRPMTRPAGSSVAARLSPRESEVLRLIAAGKTSGEISAELSLSIRTVGRHITNIYSKIGARGRADAANYASRHGLLDD